MLEKSTFWWGGVWEDPEQAEPVAPWGHADAAARQDTDDEHVELGKDDVRILTWNNPEVMVEVMINHKRDKRQKWWFNGYLN